MKVAIHRKRAATIASGAFVFLLGSTLFARSLTVSPGAPSAAADGMVQISAPTNGLADGVTVQWYAGGVPEESGL